jgi:DNA invertase Pin-like site-specific DNA recombinase
MTDYRFISYLRVSTQRQGISGRGLEAQREAVASYLNGGKWTLVQEVVEVESGRRNDRPAIAEALRLCRLHRATLIIAKLDRLVRNVHFISSLMERPAGKLGPHVGSMARKGNLASASVRRAASAKRNEDLLFQSLRTYVSPALPRSGRSLKA